MSLRTDSYLSLCLEQASMSPLHFRHGCIIVRGGKVIGQGFNDHRPHFDGGAKKLASTSAHNSTGIAALPQKNKPRTKSSNQVYQSSKHAGDTHEGCLAEAPLSMHSEMMAIHSALSLSGNLSAQASIRSAQWLQKPCFKLPGRGKRDLRLHNLKAYVKQAIAEGVVAKEKKSAGGQHRGESQVQAWRFERCSSERGEREGYGDGGAFDRGVQHGEEAVASEE